eukprot:881658-Amphidinium_carterae.1
MAADMAGLLREHAARPGSKIAKAKKVTELENHAVYNVIRAWGHQLRLAGHSLNKFVAELGHTQVLKP